jgi:hypothetical protein
MNSLKTRTVVIFISAKNWCVLVMISQKKRIGSLVASLILLTTTEFIAFGFYVVPFFRAVRGYDMNMGVGFVRTVSTSEMGPWKLILWIILLANAIHFHLSNWDVDEDKEFATLKNHGIGTVTAPSTTWISIEWLLRVFGLLCVYVMPLTLINGRGWSIEFIVIGLYLSVFLWDCMVAGKLGMGFSAMLKREYRKPSKEEKENPLDPLKGFKFKVNLWFLMEGMGLILSCLYLILAIYSYAIPSWFTLFLGVIVFLYFLIVFIESCAIDYKSYWSRAIWCALFMVVLFFIHSLVDQVKSNGGDYQEKSDKVETVINGSTLPRE